MTKKVEEQKREEKIINKADQPILKELEPVKETKISINLPFVIIGVAIIFSGIVTGYVMAKGSGRGKAINGGGVTSEGLKKVVGLADEKTFKDSAEGVLREGGANKSEGTHHLERPGGPSQNVYLTSSTVALSDYKDKKVKVWGETFAAKTAGWLMDVGRLELQE